MWNQIFHFYFLQNGINFSKATKILVSIQPYKAYKMINRFDPIEKGMMVFWTRTNSFYWRQDYGQPLAVGLAVRLAYKIGNHVLHWF